MDEARLK